VRAPHGDPSGITPRALHLSEQNPEPSRGIRLVVGPSRGWRAVDSSITHSSTLLMEQAGAVAIPQSVVYIVIGVH
jgi:hypothetical protein